MAVEKGKKIKVEYTGTLEDGSVFDSSEKHGAPLEFTAGEGQMIKGFDDAVVGMEKDEEKEFSVEPAEAYGEPKDELVREFPKEQVPTEEELKPGMVLAVTLPEGQQVPVVVKDVNDTNVTLDFNHPLAGKKLNFKIKVTDIE
jgi:FKBP-type peptidyl-prolyl cis-trans isomerase 2